MYIFGDVVLAQFPFTDLLGSKRRPALVVSKVSDAGDLILCFISSVPRTGPGIVAVEPNGSNGLKQRSVIRFDKIATLSTSLIGGRIGELSADWLHKHSRAFHGVFGFPVGGPAPKAL